MPKKKFVWAGSVGEGLTNCIFGYVDKKGGDGRVNSVQ
jgi:hypothetical protein